MLVSHEEAYDWKQVWVAKDNYGSTDLVFIIIFSIYFYWLEANYFTIL